ncbi:DUF1707 domain-containing protein [Umezawaea sp. NPDC059074]|uniref:DUF1707 SHOCT-like domain-containing protein n=1 Tax=Umezawaea sp. NPDC059074 TaxID=3346716 RepID=UPI0036A26DF0
MTQPVLRVSDQEREQAVVVLNQAVSDGRLTWEEHFDRVQAVYTAEVSSDLAPVLEGLAVVVAPQRVHAVASKIHSAPVSHRIEARATFGALVLDLSGLPAGERFEVEASSFCGKVTVLVSAAAVVLDGGTARFGKRALPGAPTAPAGPVITVTGNSTFGHLRVVRPDSHWARHALH